MSVHRVMGIETEYGISVPGRPHINSMLASSQVVNAHSAPPRSRSARTRWDYDEEAPLRDARGYDQPRADADSSQLTDEDMGLANVILTNGARLYVDHAHPEYATPEVTNPLDGMLWDRAGEVIMAAAADRASRTPGGAPLRLYKNNTDNKGASYGTHENYLMDRAVPFSEVVTGLIPFLVSRPVFAGAGRVGIGQDGAASGFQLSQRADFFEVEVGLETTVKRPIINTRDEPHADPERYRRLHVIVGDANLSQTATYLKLGTTALVLTLIEAGWCGDDLMPLRPVEELHSLSRDPSLRHLIQLRDGRRITGIQLQWEFFERSAKFCSERYGTDQDTQTQDVLDRWADTLNRLESDPDSLGDTLDWVAKRRLLDGYRRRDGMDWDSPRLQLVDLQYSDIRPEKGLARRLEQTGRLRTLVSDADVAAAVTDPPTDTRAWFRGQCMSRFADRVAAASWDSVIFDIPGHPALQRVPTLDPLRGTREHVEGLLDTVKDAEELLARLGRNGRA